MATELQARKRLLMIALDFPPCQSAGVQRTYKFAEYLRDFGWDVVVLTVKESVYQQTDAAAGCPQVLHVERCAALDAARDLSWRGKYLGFSCVPDRWWSWALTAIPAGKRLIQQFKPDLIWSTYPVSTAHYIAYRLQRYSGLPWIADYRDPLQSRYDASARRYSGIAKWIEQQTIRYCQQAVFTTDNAARLYHRLYANEPLSKFTVIENGFDEVNFQRLPKRPERTDQRFVLLHSGALYGQGRDPSDLYHAMAVLQDEGLINADNFALHFRGFGGTAEQEALLQQLGIRDLVHFLPGIPYLDSLAEMQQANSLLLIQGQLFNNQIPSKLYDYIRSGRLILALTPNKGSTYQTLQPLAHCHCADGVTAVAGALRQQLASVHAPVEPWAGEVPANIAAYSRYERTRQLAQLMQQVLS
ncbi:glycosyltransferase [Alkalimonas sp.]|uniref:glycosyltransferase n=1 Tax=Alkalimonas sp. TaxID=1872453 RepID=UPI00263A4D03|nr:glycosyltransferase [Alkalimonas sp.]MCC5827073.1 glycosyltransferase [Alkalimonas sp.]